MPYAKKTRVPVEQSRFDVEKLLARYGGRMMATYMPDDAVVLVFAVRAGESERLLRLSVPLPAHDERGYDQKVRGRWRVLLLLLKAKLEAVALGVRTLDEEFLSDVVTHSGKTVGDMMLKQVRDAYQREGLPVQALPAPTSRQLTAGSKGSP